MFTICIAKLGEPGEGGGGTDPLEGQALCQCEQSTYFAGLDERVDCDALEIIYFYHPDYLGSVEFITDMRGEPYQFFLNTPWGENLENQFAKNHTSFSSRFRFNGKEWDEETGNYYYGARYYDPKVSVWLSVDPLAAEFPSWTPYHFVHNNPVNLVDPDGRSAWQPDGQGNLVAEKNDNMQTLAKSLGVSVEEATQLYNSQNSVYDEVCEGDVVSYNNAMSRDIANNGSKPDDIGANYNYNCYPASLTLSSGKEIDASKDIYIGCPTTADEILLNGYEQVGVNDLTSGKSLIRFGVTDAGRHPHKAFERNSPDCFSTMAIKPGGAQHYAVFYNRSNDGTIYCYTKNGSSAPKIMTLQAVMKQYGNVIGIGAGSGFYNSK